MATYEQAMTALKAADAAGNVEDAKRLAAIANELKPQTEQFSFSETERQAMRDADRELYSPTSGMSGWEKIKTGFDKAVSHDIPTAIKQMAFDYMDNSGGIPAGLGEGYAPPVIPKEAVQRGIEETQQEVEESRQRDAPLMNDPYGIGGNIAGGVAALLPIAAVPGANTYTGSALAGALYGALTPAGKDESRSGNMAMGAGAGAVGKGVVDAAGRALNPVKNAVTESLRKSGVSLTPGQTMGGAYKTAEEKMMSIPLIGDFIRNAQKRGIDSFNKAIANRVLAPIGQAVDDGVSAGRELFDHAAKKVSQAYDDAINSVTVGIDKQFIDEMANVSAMVKELPEDLQSQFSLFLSREVKPRVGAGNMGGNEWKKIHSEAGRYANSGNRGNNYFDDQLKDAYSEVRRIFGDLLNRNNPEAAAMVSQADEAYKMLSVMQDASKRAGSKGGEITPNQLVAAIRSKSSDGSLARGSGTMQDFAEGAQARIANEVPNSGTTDRLLLNLLTFGGGAAINLPATLATAGAGAGLYSKAGSALTNALLNQRPTAVRATGEMIKKGGVPAALTGAGVANR